MRLIRLCIGSTRTEHTATYDIPSETIEEVLEAYDSEVRKRLGGGVGLTISWAVALCVDAIQHCDGERERSLREMLPDDANDKFYECVGDLLELVDLPKIGPYRLKVKTRGIPGKSGYDVVATWEDRDGAPLRSQPEVEGGMFLDSVEGKVRLTLGQFRVLKELPRLGEFGKQRHDDLLAPDRIRAAVSHCPEGVTLDRMLERNRFREIQRFKPRIVPRGSEYELEPALDGVPAKDVCDYFYNTPASAYGRAPLKWKSEGGFREKGFVSSMAADGLRTLRENHVLGREQVAHALSDPAGLFGDALDLSEFSERVTGIGVPVLRATALLREVKGDGWWEWSAIATIEQVEDLSLEAKGPDLPPSLRAMDLSDPGVRTNLAEAIAKAEMAGDTFIPDPHGPGFLELSSELRDAVAAAEKLASASDPDGRLSKAPREVLQVEDNFTSLRFDRARPAAPQRPERSLPPPGLSAGLCLHAHQQEGYDWLWGLYKPATPSDRWRGALLADDMGVGKTLQVLSFFARMASLRCPGSNLVVAPPGLLGNWLDETRKFFGAALEPVALVTGRDLATHADHTVTFLGGLRIVLASYETLRSHERTFAKVPWNVVVLDEAQKAKNPGTQLARVVRTLQARFRLAMTGTPVENSLGEMWTIYDWALPGLLGSLQEFTKTYIRPVREGGLDEQAHLAARLHETIAPVFMRRMKSEIPSKLPECVFHASEVGMSPLQAAEYRHTREEPNLDPLARLQRLFAICAHPELPGENRELSNSSDIMFPKVRKLFEILDAVRQQREKIIVFANRKRIHRWLKREIGRRYDLDVAIIDGQITDSRRRMDMIAQFGARPGFNAIVLSTRAAGVGLNITAANHVVHYTREWNPAVENQATDRVYRLGQERRVHVHTLVVTSSEGKTVDVTLDGLLEAKRRVMGKFVVPMGGFDLDPTELEPRAGRVPT
ncbi:MAG: DEAD/DEAH box helicase [Nannocystaceae bacterium]